MMLVLLLVGTTIKHGEELCKGYQVLRFSEDNFYAPEFMTLLLTVIQAEACRNKDTFVSIDFVTVLSRRPESVASEKKDPLLN